MSSLTAKNTKKENNAVLIKKEDYMLPEKINATATFYVITVDFLFCAVLISAIPLCVSNQENNVKS